MYISGAGFEEYCSGISGDVLDSAFYCLGGTIYDVITFLICMVQGLECLWNERGCSGGEDAVVLCVEKPFS